MIIHENETKSVVVVMATQRRTGEIEFTFLEKPNQGVTFGSGRSEVTVCNARPQEPGSEIKARVITSSNVQLDWSNRKPVGVVGGKVIIPIETLNDGVSMSMPNPRTKYEKISAVRFSRVYEFK